MDLDALTEWQHGVFSYRQAREAGYSAAAIKHLLAGGDWVELPGQVLTRPGTPLTSDAKDYAAWLGAGWRAVASGPTAARWHGWQVAGPRPCVTLPSAMRGTRLAGVRLLFDDLPDCDIDFVDGILLTSRFRTVIDCLTLVPFPEALRLLDVALQKSWIEWDVLCARVRARTGRAGTPQLVRLIRAASVGTRSDAERRLVRLLRKGGMTGWQANVAVTDHLGAIGEVDIVFRACRLAIEVDGRAWHSAAEPFQRDRTKQNRLVAAGWTVLRFTWEDITRRPEQVIATIRTSLARLAS
jgi:very-short-patch-repair endonuclease